MVAGVDQQISDCTSRMPGPWDSHSQLILSLHLNAEVLNRGLKTALRFGRYPRISQLMDLCQG